MQVRHASVWMSAWELSATTLRLTHLNYYHLSLSERNQLKPNQSMMPNEEYGDQSPQRSVTQTPSKLHTCLRNFCLGVQVQILHCVQCISKLQTSTTVVSTEARTLSVEQVLQKTIRA